MEAKFFSKRAEKIKGCVCVCECPDSFLLFFKKYFY